MALIRPRLTDHFGVALAQADVDFAIPFLDEDIPLYVDPFLLWKSPSLQDNALHTAVLAAFNHIGRLGASGKDAEARSILIALSECDEVGLGSSAKRRGKRIGEGTADEILSLFRRVPQISERGFAHLEEVQLLVDQISKDRVSDISCSLMKSFLIDYTIQECKKYGLPIERVRLEDSYDFKKRRLTDEVVDLPVNPATKAPVLLVPKRWLRFVPWINYDDYFKASIADEAPDNGKPRERIAVLTYNRENYGAVQTYVAARERLAADCLNDPLFSPLPVTSAKRKFAELKKLPSGTGDSADKKYEDLLCQLLATLLYPQLDYAKDQVRTDSGALIRDLLFYNTRSSDFLRDLHDQYGSKQLVMELKNVAKVERDHVNQLNRYLNDQFGRFGVLVTRKPLPRNIVKNTIDLWSGQRRVILALTDDHIEMMVSVFESKQRLPIEVLNKVYVEFIRACPS